MLSGSTVDSLVIGFEDFLVTLGILNIIGQKKLVGVSQDGNIYVYILDLPPRNVTENVTMIYTYLLLCCLEDEKHHSTIMIKDIQLQAACKQSLMIKLSCLTLEFTCHAIKLLISEEYLSQIIVSRQWQPYLFTLLAVGPCGAKLNRNYLIASITRFLSLLRTETADVRGLVSKADSVYWLLLFPEVLLVVRNSLH